MKKTLFLSAILGAALCNSAFGAEYTITGSDDARIFTATSEDTIIFNITDKHLKSPDGYSNGITAKVRIDALTLNNGYGNRTYTFHNAVTGNGDLNFTGSAGSDNQNYVFNGDMSAYSGNMLIADSKTGSFTFNNNTTGTGSISGARVTLNLNSATSNASAINVSTVNVSGAGVTVGMKNVTAGRIIYNPNQATHVELSGENTLTGMLDLSTGSDSFAGDLTLKANASLTQNGTLWMRQSSKGILLEKDASYTHGILTLTGISEDANNLGQLVSTNSDTYDIAKTNFQLKNVAVTIKNPGNHDTELKNKLVNASLTYTNATANKTLKLYGSGNTLTGISMGNGATLSIASGSTSLSGDASLNSLAVASGAAFSITGGTTTLSSGATLDIMSAVNVGTGATLSLSNSTLKLENMVHSAFEYGELQTSGITSRQATYTLVSGDGSVTRTGNQTATTYGASVGSLTWADDNKSFTASETLYRVLTGEANEASISDVNAAVSQQGAAFIQVDGTLTGLKAPSNGTSAIPSVNVIGSGTVQVDGEFQYHNKNFLENFTGTVEILSGETHIGNQNNGAKFTNVSAIKLTGGAFKGWSTTFTRNILLSGGTLSAAGNNMTYSGRVTVDADSTIEGNGGTTTLSGFVDAKTGLITIKGSVTHSDGLDMSGDGNKYTSNMLIKTGATFTSSSNLWVSSNDYNHTTFTLEQNGKFIKDGYMLTGLENGATFVAAATQNLAMNASHVLTNLKAEYSSSAQTNNNVLAGTTILKNIGTNTLTFSGFIGQNAVLEGVMAEDGVTSNVTYSANYGRNDSYRTEGTLKNVNIANLDAGNTNGGITMDGVYGSLERGGTQRNVTLTGNGLHLTLAGTNTDKANKYDFQKLAGTGDLEKLFDGDTSFTIQNAETWSGTFKNTAESGDIAVTFDGNSAASVEGGTAGSLNLTLKGTAYTGNHISDVTLTTSSANKVSISNTLTDVALTANNNVTLTATSNALNSFSGSGALALAGGSSLTVKAGATTITDLTLGADSTITLGSDAHHDFDLTTSSLTIAGNSTINANLVVDESGTLDFSSGATLTMGCTVTIGNYVTIKIDDSELASIVNTGAVMTIINDVEGVDMNDLALTLGSGWKFVDAKGNSLDAYNLRLDVVDADNGKVNIVVAPEPATATLSLLALAALASRRRRH